MYLLLLGLLLIGAAVELIEEKHVNSRKVRFSRILFWFNVAFMIFLMLFRYGQRADYWEYRSLYNEAPFNRGFPLFWYTRNIHFEVGFRFLVNLFTCWDCPAPIFYGFISCVTIGATLYAIIKYCRLRSVALLLIMPTLFLSYYMSGVRNGLAVAIALAVLPNLLARKKYALYVLVVLLLSTIHFTSAVFLLALFVQRWKTKYLYFMVIMFSLLGLIIFMSPIHEWMSFLPGFSRLATDRPGILGIGERTVMAGIITLLYVGQKEKDYMIRNKIADVLYKSYILGYGLSMAALTSAYISQRITMPFKSLEVLLIPILLANYSQKHVYKILVTLLFMISTVMACKNLNASMPGLNLFTYQFIGVWEGPDQVMEDRMKDVRRWSTNVYDMVDNGTWVDPE